MTTNTVSATRLRIVHYCPWGDDLEPAEAFLERLPTSDIRTKVANPKDAELMRMARLDCDWHAENVRVFARMAHPNIEFLPALVLGKTGLQTLLRPQIPEGETWWLVTMGQHPQGWAEFAGRLCAAWKKRGLRLLFYAFDEASRTMPCFAEIAPSLDILIHDEEPLHASSAARLPATCFKCHRSWVANVVPFSVPFNETPEDKIVFLGSKMGLTPHRRRQVEHLQRVFGDRFIAIHDHSLPVAERHTLSRYKVSLCPEGRKFTTAAMGTTHTDRPFWSGTLGLVPVSENSATGGRLETLHREGMIVRYEHGDLASMENACRRGLEMGSAERRRIYDYFNRRETVGTVVAETLAEYYSR